MLHLFAAFAEFERNLIVERVRAGVAEAQRQGITLRASVSLVSDAMRLSV